MIKRSCLLTALLLVAVNAWADPIVHFTDLEWGPRTGWEGSTTRGAAITVWGRNFGETRGSSHVTVNGVRIANYAEWGVRGPAKGLQRITFWLDNRCPVGPGNLSVTVGGVESNVLPFTVVPGDTTKILFVDSTTGRNTFNGKYTEIDGSNGPFRDLFMFSHEKNRYGDAQYICYVRGGGRTYTTVQEEGAFLYFRSASGGDGKRKALIGYPGESYPVIDYVNAYRGFLYSLAQPATSGEGYSARLRYVTFSKLLNEGGDRRNTDPGSKVGGKVAIGAYGDHIRIVGNIFRRFTSNAWSGVTMVDNSRFTYILGNLYSANGSDSNHHNVYIKTHSYGRIPGGYLTSYTPAWDFSNSHTYVGYNEFADAVNFMQKSGGGGTIFVSLQSGSANNGHGAAAVGKTNSHLYFYNNYFHGGNYNHVYLGEFGNPIDQIYIYNNVFVGGGGGGNQMQIYGAVRHGYAYNNLFYGSTQATAVAFDTQSPGTFHLQNNIIVLNRTSNYYYYTNYHGGTVTSVNDMYYGGTQDVTKLGMTVDNPRYTRPRFVDEAGLDFRPAPGSSVIDSGDPSTPALSEAYGTLLYMDFEGANRPVGKGYDMGPYEYGSGAGGRDGVRGRGNAAPGK